MWAWLLFNHLNYDMNHRNTYMFYDNGDTKSGNDRYTNSKKQPQQDPDPTSGIQYTEYFIVTLKTHDMQSRELQTIKHLYTTDNIN